MLTERIIRDAKPGLKTRILWDSRVKGLGLRVTRNGVKSFILNYRVNGRERRATLARAAEISLRTARERAGEQLVRIRAGEPDPLERKRKAREAPTVEEGLRRFFAEFVPMRIEIGRLGARTVEDYKGMARRHIEPELGKRKIAEVTRQQVEEMALPLPRAARNRLLALTSRLFNLFETWDWRPQYSNPCRGIERAREEARDRVLSPIRTGHTRQGTEPARGTTPRIRGRDPSCGTDRPADRGGFGHPMEAHQLRDGTADVTGDEDGAAGP